MKIRRSLKIFFICAVMLMATVTVLAFSTLAANYFEQGLDSGLRQTMLEIGENTDMLDGQPKTTLGFQVVSRWQDLPTSIQEQFEPPTAPMQLSKLIENKNVFSPPDRALFLMRYDQEGQRTVYIARVIEELIAQQPKAYQRGLPHIVRIGLYASLGLAVFALFMFLLLQFIAKPIERLSQWAKNLTPDQISQPAPDFYYNELNRLAEIVKDSLSSMQRSMTREKQFLAHASHELRTPIAVVRSNTELMNRLIDIPNSTEKQHQVNGRVLRASLTMSDLCETLLWLNRTSHEELPVLPLELGTLIRQLSHDLRYLLSEKPVEVTVNTSAATILLPATLCRIVISNLIRNAYQHTNSGCVKIVQTGPTVSIINHNTGAAESMDHLGFGLGLELTERIIKQQQWDYQITESANGREVKIDFSNAATPACLTNTDSDSA